MTWRRLQPRRRRGFSLAAGRVAASRGVCARVENAGGSDDDATSGIGAQVNYSYETQKWVALGSFEHYDPEFRMATAFINRIGITSGWAFVDRSFYPDKTRYPWIRRLSFLSFTQGGRDVVAGGNDLLEVAGMRFNFTRQGFLRVDRMFGFEHWQGERFDCGRFARSATFS